MSNKINVTLIQVRP